MGRMGRESRLTRFEIREDGSPPPQEWQEKRQEPRQTQYRGRKT